MDAKKVINSTDITIIFDDLIPKVNVLQQYIIKNNIVNELKELEIECTREDLWDDNEHASRVNQLCSQKKRFLEDFKQYSGSLEFLQSFLSETDENDLNTLNEILSEAKILVKSIDSMYIQLLFSDKYDDFACFITITAGSGGLEAQDWASMLFNMYYNFGKHHEYYKAEVIEYSDKDVGIKSAVLRLSGPANTFPYGRLKGETGVHRLVRPSPFNANNNRHTSFASVIVSPEIDDTINIAILESDLRIDTYRASGAGGQHVNKTDSAVRITHIPTGIVVQCQNDRSQHRNKAEAMKMLKSRLYMLAEEQKKAEIQNQNTQKGSISWGNQIRSYVLDDSRVKDLRTGAESPQPERVLGGEINEFLDAYIKWDSAR